MGLARGLLCGFACGLVLPLVCVFNVDVWLDVVVCLIYALIGLWISVVVLCRVLWCSARLFVAMILVVCTCLVDGFGGMAFWLSFGCSVWIFICLVCGLYACFVYVVCLVFGWFWFAVYCEFVLGVVSLVF